MKSITQDDFHTLNHLLLNVRFLFILLGPDGKAQQYHEIGRSMATIMTDEVRTLINSRNPHIANTILTSVLRWQAVTFTLSFTFFLEPDLP